MRYFAFVGDISTFIRYFHFISHAECYVRQFHRRKKQTCAKNAIIYTILKKAERYFAIVGDIPTFKRYFHRILHSECYVCQLHRRMRQTCAKNATICSILKKTVRYITPVGDILTFNRYFHRILHADCYARRI